MKEMIAMFLLKEMITVMSWAFFHPLARIVRKTSDNEIPDDSVIVFEINYKDYELEILQWNLDSVDAYAEALSRHWEKGLHYRIYTPSGRLLYRIPNPELDYWNKD